MEKLESQYYNIPNRRAFKCVFFGQRSIPGVVITDTYSKDANPDSVFIPIKYGSEPWEYIAANEIIKRGFKITSRARVSTGEVIFNVDNWGEDFLTLEK